MSYIDWFQTHEFYIVVFFPIVLAVSIFLSRYVQEMLKLLVGKTPEYEAVKWLFKGFDASMRLFVGSIFSAIVIIFEIQKPTLNMVWYGGAGMLWFFASLFYRKHPLPRRFLR
jgi:hypothetical protein